jgi:hypothetical protein
MLAALVIVALLGVGASAISLPEGSSVIAYDLETGQVLARGQVTAGVLELVALDVTAERPISVHVDPESGDPLVLTGTLGPDGSIHLNADGESDVPLVLVLESAGVSLNLVVTKGEGADLTVTPKHPVETTPPVDPPVTPPPGAGNPGN